MFNSVIRAAFFSLAAVCCSGFSLPTFSQTGSGSASDIGQTLTILNERDEPEIARILDNYSLQFSNQIISRALAFRPGSVLQSHAWQTTAARLKATEAFTAVDLELERSLEGGTYNAIVHTSRKGNSAKGFLTGFLQGLPVKTSYLDISNIAGSSFQWTSKYRWDPARLRVEGQLLFPVPLPGLLFVELGTVWRSEEWDIASLGPSQYKATGVRLSVKHIPDHRLEIGGGLEYLSRSAADTGRMVFKGRYKPITGKLSSQIRAESFLARASLLGDLDYTGGTLQVANRLAVSDGRMFLDLSVKGGTSRGGLPVADYFMLGIDTETADPLRAHSAADRGRYGRGPMGTDFVLVNSDVERRLAVLPILDNAPVYGELFLDAAKLFDRNRIFQQGGWLFDAGVAVRTQLSDVDFVVLYGRNFNQGRNMFTAYIERRLW